MKLSRKVGLIVGAGIIVALLCIVLTVYFQQAGEQRELNERLDSATVLSTRLKADKEDLEDELAQAQSSLNMTHMKYPPAVESIEYGEYIFEIVDRCDLTLSSLSFPRPTGEKVSLTLPVTGTVANIFELINTIRTDDRFASTEVNSVNLNVGGGSATISITIYIYQR